MTNTDITPEVLRAVVDWMNNRDGLTSSPDSYRLLKRADALERELANEKRIDELAKVCYRAESEFVGNIPAWDLMPKSLHETYYAGIRAVLAHIDGGEREPRTWNDLRDVPDDVQKVNDITGSMYRRFKPGPRGWEVHASGTMWSRGMDDDLSEYAPFTEAPREL